MEICRKSKHNYRFTSHRCGAAYKFAWYLARGAHDGDARRVVPQQVLPRSVVHARLVPIRHAVQLVDQPVLKVAVLTTVNFEDHVIGESNCVTYKDDG